jgi:hypothetical protein
MWGVRILLRDISAIAVPFSPGRAFGGMGSRRSRPAMTGK